MKADLLARLLDARDFATPERVRENLCGEAHSAIVALRIERDKMRAVIELLAAGEYVVTCPVGVRRSTIMLQLSKATDDARAMLAGKHDTRQQGDSE